MVSYHAVVTDNKTRGQKVRSEIYFIEILPPEVKSRKGRRRIGRAERDSVREFINRTKKIIRSTMTPWGRTRGAGAIAISADALGLKHDMTKVYDENEGQFPFYDGITSENFLTSRFHTSRRRFSRETGA